MPTPWAAMDLAVFSAFQSAVPSVKSSTSSAYSWFWTSRPRRPAAVGPVAIGKYTTPSLCMPHCCAWSAALLLASGAKAGPSDTGSPHAMSTSAV